MKREMCHTQEKRDCRLYKPVRCTRKDAWLGHGYYFWDDFGNFLTNDHIFDYDCFEYYDGELNETYRLLKAISSLIKGKIELKLFLDTYEQLKNEKTGGSIKWYTKEGLKLAGFSDKDIKKIKN